MSETAMNGRGFWRRYVARAAGTVPSTGFLVGLGMWSSSFKGHSALEELSSALVMGLAGLIAGSALALLLVEEEFPGEWNAWVKEGEWRGAPELMRWVRRIMKIAGGAAAVLILVTLAVDGWEWPNPGAMWVAGLGLGAYAAWEFLRAFRRDRPGGFTAAEIWIGLAGYCALAFFSVALLCGFLDRTILPNLFGDGWEIGELTGLGRGAWWLAGAIAAVVTWHVCVWAMSSLRGEIAEVDKFFAGLRWWTAGRSWMPQHEAEIAACEWSDTRRANFFNWKFHLLPRRLWVERRGDSFLLWHAFVSLKNWQLVFVPPLLIVGIMCLDLFVLRWTNALIRDVDESRAWIAVAGYVLAVWAAYRLAWRLTLKAMQKQVMLGEWRRLTPFSVAPRADYYGGGGIEAHAVKGVVLLANFDDGSSVMVADTEDAAVTLHDLHHKLTTTFLDGRTAYFNNVRQVNVETERATGARRQKVI